MSARISRLVLLACTIVMLGATAPGVVSITMPSAGGPFKDGPGVMLANTNCLTCHSSAYVYTQPRLTSAQWLAEVNKMKGAYGAPIPPGDIAGLVDYLVSQNGKP